MGNAINLESDSEMQDEAVTVWNIIPDEVLVHVLSYIPAKEVARAGTVITWKSDPKFTKKF